MTVAFLDLDGTLSRGSHTIRFPRALADLGLINPTIADDIEALAAAYAAGAMRWTPYATAVDVAYGRAIRGMRAEEFQGAGRAYAASPTAQLSYYDHALPLVAAVRESGRTAILTTGSPSEIVAPLALFLGVDAFHATELEIIDGRYTGVIAHDGGGRDAKRAVAERYRSEGHDLSCAAGFGDTASDLGFLNLVQHPVAVKPNDELLPHAQQRGFAICSTADEVLAVARALPRIQKAS